MNFQNQKKANLRVLSLGGWSDVNQNLFVYETPRDILVIDCGIGFPDKPLPDADILVPDVSYLQERQGKIRGVLISHGHLDHYGALPYVLPQIGNPPVWASTLVKGFIEAEMSEFKGVSPKINLVEPEDRSIRIGSFEIFPFRVNHSVPDSMGFCLKTPVGKVFHVSDFKFDLTPVDGKVFQIDRAACLAQPSTLALFSDCLGAVNPGFTSSEREIEPILTQIVAESKHQLLITTLSSNISRFQQAVRVSLAHGRKLVLLGRSVEEKIKIAQKLNYLKIRNQDLLPFGRAKKYPQNRLTYLVAGSYGQPNSALGRVAAGKHRQVKIQPGATVIFSADPAPPGTKETVDLLVDRLTLAGAKVHYYEIQENLHVSGHGSANDIRLLMAAIKPRYLIPIGGNPRHVRAFSFLAEEMGAKREQVFELFNGEVLVFDRGRAAVEGEIALGQKAIKKD